MLMTWEKLPTSLSFLFLPCWKITHFLFTNAGHFRRKLRKPDQIAGNKCLQRWSFQAPTVRNRWQFSYVTRYTVNISVDKFLDLVFGASFSFSDNACLFCFLMRCKNTLFLTCNNVMQVLYYRHTLQIKTWEWIFHPWHYCSSKSGLLQSASRCVASGSFYKEKIVNLLYCFLLVLLEMFTKKTKLLLKEKFTKKQTFIKSTKYFYNMQIVRIII